MSKSLDDSFIERVLRDKDLQKLSSVLNVDLEELRHVNDLCLLNYNYAREILIKNDWKNLTGGLSMLEERNRFYTYPEIKAAICAEYGETPKLVNAIISTHQNKQMYFCSECGKRMLPQKRKLGIDVCETCQMKKIDI